MASRQAYATSELVVSKAWVKIPNTQIPRLAGSLTAKHFGWRVEAEARSTCENGFEDFVEAEKGAVVQ